MIHAGLMRRQLLDAAYAQVCHQDAVPCSRDIFFLQAVRTAEQFLAPEMVMAIYQLHAIELVHADSEMD